MCFRSRSMLIMYQHQIPLACSKIFVMTLFLSPPLHQCSPRVVCLTQVWSVPFDQVSVVTVPTRCPVRGPAKVATSHDSAAFLMTSYTSWWLTSTVRRKAAELEHICDYTRPDILVMSDTKMDKSVWSAEFLPKCYVAIYKDRNLHGGGVMIAIHQGLIVNKIPLKGVNKDCELVFAKVALAGGAPPLFTGVYNRSQIDNPGNESLDGLEIFQFLVVYTCVLIYESLVVSSWRTWCLAFFWYCDISRVAYKTPLLRHSNQLWRHIVYTCL